MTTWIDRVRIAPWAHQVAGVERLCRAPRLLVKGALAIFDEVGAGKTKQVVDAAQRAAVFPDTVDRPIDTVVVVVPGFARSVWASPDPTLGEVAKHGWDGVDNVIHEYHDGAGIRWSAPGAIDWVVTNYEYARRPERLDALLAAIGRGRRRAWLVVDEAWAVKGHKSEQTAAVKALRLACRSAVLLNGTPVAESPLDLYAQFDILDPGIMRAPNFYAYRAKVAVMGGYQRREIVGWREEALAEYQRRIAPYILRRMTADCVDLPPLLPGQTIEARLTPATWGLYTSMRDDLLAWLDDGGVTAAQAGTRVLRLAQLCSGFLGGITVDDAPDPETREIGREKLDALLGWLEGAKPDKLVVWARFRPEVERTAAVLAALGRWRVHKIYGDQREDERDAAKRALAPGGDPAPAIVVANPAAGGAGLNFAAAHHAVYLSEDFSRRVREQADGRVMRPGQTRPVTHVSVVAVGPKGQKTFDHHRAAAVAKKEDLSRWTAAQWRQALAAE